MVPLSWCGSAGKPAFEQILADMAYAFLLTMMGLLWLVAPGFYNSGETDCKKQSATI